MKLFNRLFRKKTQPNPLPMPPWETIVNMMHDKCLDTFSCEVVKVIYSKDNTMRYIILKDSERGYFTYTLEVLHQFDEDEWKFICSDTSALPAMWEPFDISPTKSIYETEEMALVDILSDAAYIKYFS